MLEGKKVLLIHSSAGLYGADRCLFWITEDLISRGIEVDAVLPFKGPLSVKLENAGATVHLIDPVVFRRNLKKPTQFARFLRNAFPAISRIRKLIRTRRYDLVHTNTGVVVGGAIAAKLTRTPHVWHFREILTEFGILWKLYEPLVSSTSSSIICISKAVAAQFKTNKCRKMVTVVHDGIPLPDQLMQKRSVHKKGPYRLLSVGLLAPYKGQDVLIKATKTLLVSGLDVKLELVGDVFGNQTEFRTYLENMIASLGLQDKVSLAGFQADIEPYLDSADIFILPSTRPEGLGLVVLEALASGKPVIATDHGGVVEILRHKVNGILVRPGSSDALAGAIKDIINDPGFASRISENGLETVTGGFSLAKSQKNLIEVYERILVLE